MSLADDNVRAQLPGALQQAQRNGVDDRDEEGSRFVNGFHDRRQVVDDTEEVGRLHDHHARLAGECRFQRGRGDASRGVVDRDHVGFEVAQVG